jgi:hypothetical protein
MATTEKEFFSVQGKFADADGQRRFIPASIPYYRQCCSKMPLDKQFTVKFTSKVGSRSANQLKYYWVLLGLISDYNGNTPEELHDFVMRAKFGTKTITLGKISQEVRRSMSESARMPTSDCVELITFVLDICRDLEINIPSMEELGYISNDKPYH